MIRIFLKIIIFLHAILSLITGQPVCPTSGWIRLNMNKCVNYSHKKFNFTDAQQYCKSNFNSNLLTITSRQENKQLSKLLYDELQFDDNFWMNGKVNDRKGSFSWFNECHSTNYSNFHTNNHEFNVDGTEYMVLSSLLSENKHTKRKERGTWCSFRPQIMFFALCEYSLPNNKIECKIDQSINFSLDEIRTNEFENNRTQFDKDESIKSESVLNLDLSFIKISRTQAYLIIGSALMVILFVILCIILKSSCTSNRPQINDTVNNSEMY